MSTSYEIIPEKHLVVNTVRGRFDFARYQDLMERILEDPQFVPSMHMLWDFTGSTLIDLSNDDFASIKSYIQKNAERRGSGYRAVFLVSKEVDFGLSRMYQMISEDLPVSFEVFRDRDKAMAWITNG
jgi:hypothetical protein